ncbi:MAG: ABC transporter substrate-binding protein [Saccharospirillum sp.]|nr:ABC transporter substrate-binding protein [Saccharospirillum sp.]
MKRALSKTLILMGVILSANWVQAERLVSIDGAITEIVFALDATETLVGVDTTSKWPPEAEQLPNVGYMRALSAEGILSLAPERILTTTDAGPPDTLGQLSRAGVNITIIDSQYTLEGVLNKVEAVADALGRRQAGQQLQQQIQRDVRAAQQQLAEKVGPLRAMFVMDAGTRGFQVAGQNTRAHGALELAGLINVFADIRDYKPLTPEAAIAANPDVILVFHSQENLQTLAANPALAMTNAVQNGRIRTIDDIDLLAFGPRLGWSLEQLAERLAAGS